MEENIPVLKEVKPLKNFCLQIKFSDGVEGKVDLSEFAGKGVFALGKQPEDVLPKLQESAQVIE